MILSCGILFLAQHASAQFGGKAGAFSRMGFGARGIGLGNAMTAVSTGDLVGYYNPAALPFARDINIAATFGILSLDRKLNFLSYTQPVHPSAGIAFGIINSGVSDIDGRDFDGEPTGPLNTSENQIFLAFANQFKGGLSLGITLKLYHHRLYTDVASTIVGLDFGGMMKVSESITIGASVRDINSEYKWDTSILYGQDGNSTIDKFPILFSFGASYILPDSMGLVAVDVEASNQKTLLARVGVEVPLIPELTLRAGIDRIDLKEKGNGIKPTFGFTVRKGFGDWVPALNYAYVVEPFVSTGMHVISLSVVL
ncbi:MAG: hypothetical protein ACKVRP_10935 [Bacteroidota bacterium]